MFGGKAETPVVIRTSIGAGLKAASHHSQSLYPIFTHIPGLKVVVPSSPYEAKGLLIQAIRDNDPVIFCEHKSLHHTQEDVPESSYAIPFGEANILREGGDATIVAFGLMVKKSMEAASKLSKEGIQCEVIDPRSTSPLDLETIIESVENTGRLVIVDESNPRCSIAADISAQITEQAFESLKGPVKMVTAPHCPPPFSDVLEDLYIPSPEKIAEAVKSLN